MILIVGQDVEFICNECNEPKLETSLGSLGTSTKKWAKPNSCKNCGKTYTNSDGIEFGLIYITSDNKKYAASTIDNLLYEKTEIKMKE